MNVASAFTPIRKIVRKFAALFVPQQQKDKAVSETPPAFLRVRTPVGSIIPHLRTAALVETIIFLTAAILLNTIFGDGTRFIAMPVHPFWIIVLLITVQYGPTEALMAAILSSIFLFAGNMPEQSLSETMYDYILRVAFLPFLWSMAALVLGAVRARQLNERKRVLENLMRSEQAAAAIAGNYKAVKQSKEQLELRLAEERCSVLAIYEIARSLETLDTAEALSSVEKLVRVALNPKKFSLFLSNGTDLCLEAGFGWKKSDTYLKKFDLDTPFVQYAHSTGRILSIVRQEEEDLLKGEGMLAGLFVDARTGRILGMLKIEEIAFTDIGLRTHETFRIICAWIANVYINIDKYETALGTKRAPASGKPASRAGTHQPNLGPDMEIRDSAA